MKICRSCGAELPDVAAFCQVCGTPAREDAGPVMGNQITMPKTIFYLAMIALAVMGILAIGLAARSPNTITTTNVVTQMQMETVSIGYTSSQTMTIVTTMTMGGTATTADLVQSAILRVPVQS
jgi:2-methylaconitate cis-trans-isomerase PrpF